MDLIFPAAVIALCSAWIASRTLSAAAATGIAVVRVAVPVVYFSFYYDGHWNVLDDLTYFANGAKLRDLGYNPLTVLLDAEGREQIFALSQGHHVLYLWWNLLAQTLFGIHYWAPVFLNVALSFVAGQLMATMLGDLGFSTRYRQRLLVFFLLHWDVVAWSSLLNIKDVLVLTLTLASLVCGYRFLMRRRARHLVGFLLVSCLFYWIRFYVPFLLVAALSLWMCTQWTDFRKWLLIPAAIIGLSYAIPLLRGHSDLLDLTRIPYGAIRYLLTPLPWKIEPEYTFLRLPAILHCVLLVPTLGGLVILWRDSSLARLVIVYLGCVVLFYAAAHELQGPRQRFQVSFIILWAQFHWLWTMLGTQPARAGAVGVAPSRVRTATT